MFLVVVVVTRLVPQRHIEDLRGDDLLVAFHHVALPHEVHESVVDHGDLTIEGNYRQVGSATSTGVLQVDLESDTTFDRLEVIIENRKCHAPLGASFRRAARVYG